MSNDPHVTITIKVVSKTLTGGVCAAPIKGVEALREITSTGTLPIRTAPGLHPYQPTMPQPK